MTIYYIPDIFLATINTTVSHADEILPSGRLNSIWKTDNNMMMSDHEDINK